VTKPVDGFASHGYQGYTRDEMAATSAITSRENPRWRWVLPVTRSTREYIISQIPALQLSYAIAVALIFTAGQLEGAASPSLMGWWLTEATATLLARSYIYRKMWAASPVEVASRPALRMLPLLGITLATRHWSWTATIFIGPSLDFTTVVVLLSFVMLSVACLGIAPASPIICLIYLVPMWGVTAYELLHSTWTSPGTLVVLGAGLAAALWSAYYIIVSGVRKYLIQSDEVELLLNELRDRNTEVEQMRASAADEFSRRSAFFASASHDFRQRVHAMKLITHSGLSEGDREHRSGSPLVRLTTVVEDLETYMTDVLDFVRLDSTVRNPKPSTLRVQDLFQRIDLEFEDIAASRKVNFRVRTTSTMVWSDQAMLLRILENLTANAIKFARSRVLLSARVRDNEVHIDVRDDGWGISPGNLDKIFEAFYQEEATLDPERHGFGLGLAIVKRLADALDCKVRVDSLPGRGTRVRLIVPAMTHRTEGG
jgi:signal transduction histidine kinase